MRRVPWSHVCIVVAVSVSKKSWYLEKRTAGISNTLLANRKFTNMGLSTMYLKSPERLAAFSTVDMLM